MSATFMIRVVVDPSHAQRGTRQVSRQFSNLERQANRLRNAIRNAFLFASLTGGVGQIVKLADSFTLYQNRIRTVTTSAGELSAVTDQLFKISNQTRASFETTAEVYARTAAATRDLGLSQAQTLQFTKSLNHAVALSGATSIEAKNALIQFSQGMASGTLRGDELRSVLEQLPKVADVIAERFDVGRGSIKEMAAQGLITSKQIIFAFQDAADELEEAFAKSVPTVGQAFDVLRNQVLRFVGEFSEANALTESFSKFIIKLSNNLEEVARWAAAAGIAIGTYFAGQGVALAIVGMKKLNYLMRTNPFGLLVTGVVLATSYLIAFKDEITFGTDKITTLGDYASATFDVIGEKIAPIADWIKQAFGDSIDTAIKEIDKLGISMSDVGDAVKGVLNTAIGLWMGYGKAVMLITEAAKKNFLAMFDSETLTKLKGHVSTFTTFVGKAWNVVIDLTNDVTKGFVNAGKALAKATGNVDIDVDGLTELGSLADKIKDGFKEALSVDYIGDAIKVAKDTIAPTLDEITAKAKGTAQQRADDELEIARKHAEDMEMLNKLIEAKKRKRTAGKSEKALKGGEGDFTDAIIVGLQRISGETDNVQLKLTNAFAQVGVSIKENVGDAFARSITQGENFGDTMRNVANTIGTELLSSVVQIGIEQAANAIQAQIIGTTALTGEAAMASAKGTTAVAEGAKTTAAIAGISAINIASTTAMAATALSSVAAGTAIAVAYAPAAALASLASFGGNAAPAMIGINATNFLTHGIAAFAEGGYVTGAGTTTSDEIPAMLSNKEFVVNAKATKDNRGVLERMNRGESVMQLASGGSVSKSSDSSSNSNTGTVSSPQASLSAEEKGPLIVNMIDSQSIIAIMASNEGRKVMINNVRVDKQGFKSAMGVKG